MDIKPLEILKWIGIGIATGFVGYFGRYLAMLIVERIHRKKPQPTPTTQPAKEVAPAQDSRLEASQMKLEKKKAKLEAKKPRKSKRTRRKLAAGGGRSAGHYNRLDIAN